MKHSYSSNLRNIGSDHPQDTFASLISKFCFVNRHKTLLLFFMLMGVMRMGFAQTPSMTLSQSGCTGQTKTISAAVVNAFFLEWKLQAGGTTGIVSPTSATTVITPGPSPVTYVAKAGYISSTNQIVNGDFEAGQTGCTTSGQTCSGFTSDYPYVSPVTANSQYGITKNADAVTSYLLPTKDHSKGDGTGWYYYSDGGFDPTKEVYKTTVSVIKDSVYVFSAWAANLHDVFAATSPQYDTSNTGINGPDPRKSANVEFLIDGIQKGIILLPTDNAWHQFYSTYTATATGTINIAIRNRETAKKGNDFALDDISFNKVTSFTANITAAPCLIAPINTTNVGCSGGSTGSIAIGPASGGGGTYQYSINGGASWTGGPGNSYTFTNLPVGTYDVRIRDAATPSFYVILNGALSITQPFTTPSTAAAGNDQDICAATTATLAATPPTSGTGQWSVVSGTGTVTNPLLANSGVTGMLANGTLTLRWTVSSGTCTASTDDVVIKTYTTPSTAAAGNDQDICAATTATLAATAPTSGTGQWSVVSGTGAITNSLLANSGVTGMSANGTLTLRWTVSNGSCTSSTDDVVIKTYTTPSTAAAGTDQNICAATTATLAATAPTSGTGQWTVVSGTGAVSNSLLANSGVTGMSANGTLTLRWTVSNGSCTSSTDDVVIKTYTTPSTAAAGTDQDICAATTATLAATPPTSGTGQWSVVSGTGALTNSLLANSGVTGMSANGTLTLRWTVSNGPCAASTDDVVLKTYTTPSTAAAGTDQDICAATTATLAATAPTSGTGQWSVVSGTGTVTNSLLANSGVTGMSANGTLTLRWTVSNGSCAASTDDVVIKTYTTPSTAAAGTDQILCNTATTTLAATSPTSGTGKWSVVSGTGTVTNLLLANSGVTGMSPGTLTLRWTVSNGTCAASTSDVVITNKAATTTADAGPDQSLCTDNTTLGGNTPGSGQTGTWTIVTGSGIALGNINNPNSTVTGLVAGSSYTLRWTITNAPCASSSNDVVVNRQASAIPTVTIAASSSNSCAGSTVNFTIASITNEGSTPTYQWQLNGVNIPGAAGTGTTYSSSSLVTGDQITLTFLSSLVCASPSAASSNTVNMTVSPVPTKANANVDQTVCGTIATLAGNSPSTGTGLWTVIGGTANITNPSNPVSGVTGLVAGTVTTLRWAVSSGPCAVSADTMTITDGNMSAPTVTSGGPTTFCAGGSVVLSITPPVAGLVYQWSNASGPIGSGSSYTATANGVYTVIATDPATNCTSPASSGTTVVVNPRSNTSGITGPAVVCEGNTGIGFSVTFTTGSSYAWLLPSGATIATGANTNSITVDFAIGASNGDITVTETSAAGCADLSPSTFSVTVNRRPSAPLSIVGDTNICNNSSGNGNITLSATGGAGGTLTWYTNGCGGGAGTYLSEGPLLTLAAPAVTTTYYVRSELGGCQASACLQTIVNINARPPQPSITTNGPTTFCGPGSVLLTSSNTGASTYQWYNGTTLLPGETNASYTASASGNYKVIAISSASCTSPASDDTTVTINPKPNVPVVIAGDTTVFCSGGSVTLKITSDTTGLTFQWANPTVAIPNARNSNYTTFTGGNYSVTVTNAAGCSSSSTARALIVNPRPVLIDSAKGSGSCSGAVVQLFSYASGGSNSFTYHWTAIQDPAFDRTAQNPAFTAPGASTDYIIVVQDASTNSISCSARDTVTLLVASPFLSAGGKLPLCAGTPNTFVPAVLLNQTAPIYTWVKVSGNNYLSPMSTLNPTITVPSTVTQSDTSKYKLTVNDNGCQVTDTFTLIFNPVPSVTLSTSDSVVCGGSAAALNALIVKQTSPGYAYHWLQTQHLGVGPESDTLGRKFTSSTADIFSATAYPDSNFYHVTLVDSKGCRGLSDTVQVKAYDKQNLVIPNLITPNNDHKNECFIIKDQNNFDILPGSSLEIYNSWGQAVFKAKNYSNTRPWCGSSLTDGVYYYYIKTGCGENEIKGWLHIMSNEASSF